MNSILFFRSVPVGILQANCYIIGCKKSNRAAIVDPGGTPDLILNIVKKYHLRVEYIFNTHGHFDHISANRPVKQVTDAKLLIHRADADWLVNPLQPEELFGSVEIDSVPADEYLHDGDCYYIGQIELKVIHTPGHSKGSVCFLLSDRILTGDTLFCGSVGRTDLPGGSEPELYDSIRTKLLSLPDDLLVFPGHGPATTIQVEKESNPFLIRI
ncbi:MAG: MBL fold metallo-hydrolase [bacterium]|nr:MBL fold metallo-hydrolase [bacterium]